MITKKFQLRESLDNVIKVHNELLDLGKKLVFFKASNDFERFIQKFIENHIHHTSLLMFELQELLTELSKCKTDAEVKEFLLGEINSDLFE